MSGVGRPVVIGQKCDQTICFHLEEPAPAELVLTTVKVAARTDAETTSEPANATRSVAFIL